MEDITVKAPCPFCGSVRVSVSQTGYQNMVAVGCENIRCRAIGPDAESAELAIRLWDRRPPYTAKRLDSVFGESFSHPTETETPGEREFYKAALAFLRDEMQRMQAENAELSRKYEKLHNEVSWERNPDRMGK